MKFELSTPTLLELDNLLQHIPAKDVKFKGYFPKEGNKSFNVTLHLTDEYKLEHLKNLISQLGCPITVLPFHKDRHAEYKTTIEKLGPNETFVVLTKNGTHRGRTVYEYKGYNRSTKKHEGRNYKDINDYKPFQKGQLVVANPDF